MIESGRSMTWLRVWGSDGWCVLHADDGGVGVCRFMFVPFGQGPRVCIGQHFSLMESRVVLATLLQHFKMHLQRPYEIKWRANILPSQPEGGVPITVEHRS